MPIVGGVTAHVEIAPGVDAQAEPSGGQWVDLVAADVVRRAEARRGRPGERQHVDVGTLRVEVDNRSGDFDPTNPAGQWFGDLKPDTHIRLRATVDATTVDRWRGLIERITPHYPRGRTPFAVIEAKGPLWRASRTNLTTVGFPRRVLTWSPAPKAYWRLGDGDSGSIAEDATGRRNLAAHAFGARVRTEGGLVADQDAGTDLGSAARCVVGTANVGFTGTSHGLFMLVRPRAWGTSQRMFQTRQGGPTGENPQARLSLTSTGEVVLMDNSSTLLITSGIAIPVNEWSAVGFRRSGSTWELGVHNGSSYWSGTDTFATSSQPSWPVIGGYRNGLAFVASWDGDVDEVVVWPDADPGTTMMATLAELALRPGYGEAPVTRWRNLMLNVAGVPASMLAESWDGFAEATSVMEAWRPSDANGTVLGAVRKLSETATAEITETADGKVRYAGRALVSGDPTPVAHFSDLDDANIGCSEITPTQRHDGTQTKVSVSDGVETTVIDRTGGQEALADLDLSVYPGWFSVNITTDVATRAARELASPRPRTERIAVQLGALTDAQRLAVLGLEHGDPVRVTVGGRSAIERVAQMTDAVTPSSWTAHIATDPLPLTVVPSARVTSSAHRAFATSGSSEHISMLGEVWDDDAMANGPAFNVDLHMRFGSYHLVGASTWWEGNATGARETQVDEVDTAIWAVVNERGSSQGVAQIAGTVLRTPDAPPVVPRLQRKGKQSSGGSLQAFASRLGDPQWAWAPDIFAVRLAPSKHIVRARRSANLSISHATTTTVDLNTEDFDTASMHDNSTNNSRLTAQKVGTFLLGGQASFAANATNGRDIVLRRDGGTEISQGSALAGTASESTAVHATALWRASAVGQYVEMRALQRSGGALNVQALTFYSPVFWAVELDGPTCRVTRSAAKGIPHEADPSQGTGTAVDFSSTRWEEDSSMWDAGQPTRLVVPASIAPGTIAVPWGGVIWAANATGMRRLSIRHVSATGGAIEVARLYQPALTSDVHGQTVWTAWKVNPGDYFELVVGQSSGGSLNLNKTAEASPEFGLGFITSV